MMNLSARILLVAVMAALFSIPAAAMPPRKFRQIGGSDQPAVSPYLNLLNQTQSLETNYFQRALPELELRSATQQLGNSVRGLNADLQQQQAAVIQRIRPTGHKTTFFNAGSYFFGSRQQHNAGR